MPQLVRFAGLPRQMPESYYRSGEWQPDLLGAGFEAQTLELPPDEEGELYATLVRYRAEQDPQRIEREEFPAAPGFVLLYLHGWNDYFYQRELARHIELAGGAFYALDLSKYGRSWRPWHTFGWCENLLTYDLDLAAAIELIRAEHPQLPLVLLGHSTGGLISAYWAKRHADQLSALILTSPWIAMPKGNLQRQGAFTVGSLLPRRHGRSELPFQKESDSTYWSSLQGWAEEYDGVLPESLRDWQADPSLSGWPLIPEWKGNLNAKIRIGWLSAIAKAQGELLAMRPLECPVYFYAARESYFGKRNRKAMYADSVLNVETLTAVAGRTGYDLTLQRFEGKHDPVLSFPPTRQEFWLSLHRWLATRVPGAVELPRLSRAAQQAICP